MNINFFVNSKNFDETDEESKNIIKKRIKITTKENTLHVAFTNGFHRRTEFKRKSKRSMMFFQYVKNFNKFHYLFR